MYLSHNLIYSRVGGKLTLVKGVSFFLIPTNNGERLCDNNEGTLFRCVPSGAHFFIYRGRDMNNYIPRKVIDISGVELTPAEPDVCLGNGESGFECCCDECDYFLLCFPEFDTKSKRINKIKIPHAILQKQRKRRF